MPLNTVRLTSGPQTGKSLIALGAAKEFILRDGGPSRCAIVYPTQDQARNAMRIHRLPMESMFWASAGIANLYGVPTRRFLVFEDITYWPRVVYIELLNRVHRADGEAQAIAFNSNSQAALRTLILTS